MGKLFNQRDQAYLRKKFRKEQPSAEQIVWSHLRARRLDGHKFRRQFGIGPYVVDFFCPKLKLVIEIDGESHYLPGAQEKDRTRQEFLENNGLKVLRFSNDEVYSNVEGVLENIHTFIHGTPAQLTQKNTTKDIL